MKSLIISIIVLAICGCGTSSQYKNASEFETDVQSWNLVGKEENDALVFITNKGFKCVNNYCYKEIKGLPCKQKLRINYILDNEGKVIEHKFGSFQAANYRAFAYNQRPTMRPTRTLATARAGWLNREVSQQCIVTRTMPHMSKRDKLFKQGRFGDAAMKFRLAVDEWPEDWQAHWALGNWYSEMKKPRKAEESFREAIMHAPAADVPSLYFNLGNALLDQEKYKEAIDAYGEIPSGHPLSGSVSRNISLIRERIENGT